MPEMPEVEVMTQRLHKYVGQRITDVQVDKNMSSRAARKYLPEDEYNSTIGQAITGVYRRGKMIVFTTSSGALLCHNAMSGFWDTLNENWTFDYVEGKRSSKDSDVRVALTLDSGETLRFHDARMFGSLRFVDPNQLAQKLSKLGPEADHTVFLYEPSKVISPEQFHEICEDEREIKTIITDQDLITGIGNIYAVEACWYAGIDPFRTGASLSKKERYSLFLSIRSVLRQALERRLDYAGLKVYRRKKCSTCQGEIANYKLNGRSTYWCPKCQK